MVKQVSGHLPKCGLTRFDARAEGLAAEATLSLSWVVGCVLLLVDGLEDGGRALAAFQDVGAASAA